jgi:hypothetical protein
MSSAILTLQAIKSFTKTECRTALYSKLGQRWLYWRVSMQRLTIRLLPLALAALACASPLLAPTPTPDSPDTEDPSPTPEGPTSTTDIPAPEAAPTETNAPIIPATGLIAYTRFGIEGAQILVFDWETAKSTQLTSGGFSASYPLWSPDGWRG